MPGTFAIRDTHSLTPEDLSRLVGSDLGESGWHQLSEQEGLLFAQATGEPVCSPSVGAQPFMILSLAPRFIPEVFGFDGFRNGLNYGCNNVRFPTPLPFGSWVRGRFTLQEVIVLAGGCRVVLGLCIEAEGSDVPACAAEIVLQYFD